MSEASLERPELSRDEPAARPFGILPGQSLEKPAAWAAIVAAVGAHIAILIIGNDFIDEPQGFDRMWDFDCFYQGALAWNEAPETLYEVKNGGYIYPPLLAFVLSPLAKTGFHVTGGVWVGFMWSLVPLMVWLTALEVRERIGSIAGAGGRAWSALNTAGVASIGYLAVAEKINKELIWGNSNMLIVLAFVLGLRWLDRRPVLAGIAIGVFANIKYLPLVVVPYLVLRGRWKTLAGVVGGFGFGAFLPAIDVGWEQNLEFWRAALGGMSNSVNEEAQVNTAAIHHLTWDRSASIPSALARAVGVGSRVWLIAGGIAAAIVGWAWWSYKRAGWGLFSRGGPQAERTSRGARVLVVFEWSCLIAVCLAFSPQAVARHFNMALPAAIGVAALACAVPPGVRRWKRYAALGGVVLFALSLVMPPRLEPDTLGQPWRDMAGMSLGLLGMMLLAMPRALDLAGIAKREQADVD